LGALVVVMHHVRWHLLPLHIWVAHKLLLLTEILILMISILIVTVVPIILISIVVSSSWLVILNNLFGKILDHHRILLHQVRDLHLIRSHVL